MGQDKKQKKKAQAEQIFLSPSAGGGAGPSGAVVLEKVDELVLSLIRLDLDVLEKVAEGDWVKIDTSISLFEVTTKYGLVGKVPERYEVEIKENRLFGGRVTDKRSSPPGLRIVLKR